MSNEQPNTRGMRDTVVALLLLNRHSDPLFSITDVLETVAELYPFVKIDHDRLKQFEENVDEVMRRADAEVEVRDLVASTMRAVFSVGAEDEFEVEEPHDVGVAMEFDDPMEAE